MFTDIGQEVQHANELLVRLNQWKKWCQVKAIRTYKLINIRCRLKNGKCQHRKEHGSKHRLYRQFIE